MDFYKKDAIFLAIFAWMLLDICNAKCPPEHTCQNNVEICVADIKYPEGYTCNCQGTEFTGPRCEFERGSMEFIAPKTMEVGESEVFTIVLTKSGDQPRFYLHSRSDLSFEFVEASFRPVSEYYSFAVTNKVYPESAKAYQFWYSFSEKKDYALTAVLVNGYTDENTDYKLYLSQRESQKISVMNPILGVKCFPNARLTSVSRHISYATKYYRTDRIVITLGLQYCGELSTKTIYYTWKLYRLDTTFPTPLPQNDWGLANIVDVNQKYIIFEPHQLMIGRYLVEVEFRAEGDSFNNTRKGFFSVEANKPKVIIRGGKEITASVANPVVLDASSSIDLSFPDRSDELIFSWRCDELESWEASGSVVTLPPDTLTLGTDYNFIVNVSSARSNTFEEKYQTVHTSHFGLVLSCTKICEKVQPDDVISVQCSCPDCSVEPEFTFSWYPQEKVKIKPKGSTALITVPALQGIREDSAFIICQTTWEGVRHTAKIEFETALPPEDTLNPCSISPTQGTYLVDPFVITCSNNEDEGSHLQYAYYAFVPGVDISENQLLLYYEQATSYNILQLQATDILLPFGDSDDDLIVFVAVSKDGVVISRYPISVTVTIPDPDVYVSLLEKLVLNPESKLKLLLKLGYEQEALELVSTIIYGLIQKQNTKMEPLINSLKSNNKFSSVVKELSSSLTKISLTDENALKQVIDCINLLSTVEVDLELEPDTDQDDNSYLIESSSTILRVSKEFRNRMRDGAELSLNDVESFGKTVADTASKILKLMNDRGNTILKTEIPFSVPNERRLVDQFDLADDVNRNYFLDDLSEDDDDWGDKEFKVETESNEKIAELAYATRDAFLALDYMMDMVADQRAVNQDPFEFNDLNLAIHVEVRKANEEFMLERQGLGSKEFTVVKIPSTIRNSETENPHNVEIQIREMKDNPFFDDLSAVPGSPILSVVLKDVDNHLPIHREDKAIEFTLPIEEKSSPGQSAEYTVTVRDLNQLIKLPEISNADMPIRRFILPYGSQLEVSIEEGIPNPGSLSYGLIFLKDELPTPSHFCDSNIVEYLPSKAGDYSLVFETEKWDSSLGEPTEKFLEYYIGIWVVPNLELTIGLNKTFRVFFSRTACVFRDEGRKIWSEDGCSTRRNLHGASVSCSCEHLSVFTASTFVFPNELKSIILTDFDLSELEDNYIVILTVCTSLVIYFLCLLLCWFWDRRTIANSIPITIMADLSDDFEYAYYLVIVITGSRFDAGTSANISLQIYGSCGRSQTYTLKEGGHAVCNRGAVDYYLVSSPKDLGELEKIRLWHDNYGDSPSWYCNKIIIRNIKTDVESQFFIEKWISVSHLYPTLIVQKQVGRENDKRSLFRIFKDNIANEFNNSHLWLSVMTRPQNSSFTRCQRLTCAYAVFSSYMLLTIMFHGKELIDLNNRVEVGGHEINIPTLILWIQNVLFALPIGFFVLFFFKNLTEYEIPTLIIWKNKTKPDKSEKAENLFVPKAPPPPPPPKEIFSFSSERKDNFYYEGEGSDNSSVFSLPSTDIKEVEGWVIGQTEGEGRRSYEDREPDAFIHAVKEDNDQNHMDRLHRLGRHALVHSVRETDPRSFIFTGDLDIKGIEKLIDEQLNLQAAEKRPSGDKRKVKEIREPWQNLNTRDLLDIENDMKTKTLHLGVPLVTAEEKKESPRGLVIELCDMPPVHKHCGYLPWWFVFFAWIISLGCIITCNYFTLIYGLNLGYLKSLDWFLSVMSSFLLSVFIVQPVKIAIVSGLKALFYRKLNNVHQDKFQLLICVGDEEFKDKKPRKILVFRPDRAHPPLSGHETFLLKLKARRHRELRRKLLYLILYCLMLAPLIIIAHSTHSIHNYRVTENLRNLFKLDENNKQFISTPSEAFLNIKDEASLFGYLRLTFLTSLHPTRMYNGQLINPQRFDSGFLADFTTILVGVARVRQLRMDGTSCETSEIRKKLNVPCIADYSIARQDTNSYNPLWTPVKNGKRQVVSSANDIWKFRSQEETGSLPLKGWMGYYDGGGYIAELGRNRRESASVLKHLKHVKWFDEHTRCIFIEFGTFTPSLNIFTSVILMIEKGSSSGMKMTSHIYPMIVLHPEFTTDGELSGNSLAVATCLFLTSVMLVVLIVIFVWRVMSDMDEDIVTRLWFWLDIFIMLSIIVSMFIAERSAGVTLSLTKDLDRMLVNQFVNLQRAALWDQIQRVAFSITQIFCFIRIWNILVHSSDKFLMLTLTLKLTARILIGFSILFATLLFGFALAGNLLFGNHLEEFYTVTEALVTLAHQTIQVDFFYDLEKSNKFLGPLYFFCFGIFIIFVTINLFIALLNQGLFQAKEIATERRHWITYWAYTKRFFTRMLANVTHRRVKKRKQSADVKESLDILPSKLLEMKKTTIKYLRDKLNSEEEALMTRMKHNAENLLRGTGFRMVTKGDKESLIKANKETKMEEMRICTAEFIRIKTGVYMTPEELRNYEKYNTSINTLRLNKLQRNVDLVVEKVDRIVDCFNPQTTNTDTNSF